MVSPELMFSNPLHSVSQVKLQFTNKDLPEFLCRILSHLRAYDMSQPVHKVYCRLPVTHTISHDQLQCSCRIQLSQSNTIRQQLK